jgi:hypothetical protein
MVSALGEVFIDLVDLFRYMVVSIHEKVVSKFG